MADKVVNRLRVLRAEKNWSQAQLAESVGVSRQAINSIENGRHDPSITLAYRISRALNADIAEAFQFPGGDDPSNGKQK
ncbi:MAG: helix-turn-helix transcriptional regulator [Pseudomonadota bacterium]